MSNEPNDDGSQADELDEESVAVAAIFGRPDPAPADVEPPPNVAPREGNNPSTADRADVEARQAVRDLFELDG